MDNQLVLQLLRVAFIICLYFLTFACYLTPILITKYWKSKAPSIASPNSSILSKQCGIRIISWFNCTAIGIFLSTCFLGIIPSVKDLFINLLKKIGEDTKFPVTEFFIVFGFILTLLLEQAFFILKELKESRSQDDIEQNQGLLEECEMQDLSDEPSNLQEDHEQSLVDGFRSRSLHLSNNDEENANDDDLSINTRIDHGRGHSQMALLSHQGSCFAFIVLVVACGLHSVFQGITLGLQTSTSKSVHLFIGIIIYECLMVVSLGINATKLRYSLKSHFQFALILSAFIPFGVITGMLIQHAPGIAGEMTSAVLQAISAGIFLHVTFHNNLPSEFLNRKDRILKVLFVFFGFISMAVITFLFS